MKQLKGKCQQKKEHEDIGNKKNSKEVEQSLSVSFTMNKPRKRKLHKLFMWDVRRSKDMEHVPIWLQFCEFAKSTIQCVNLDNI